MGGYQGSVTLQAGPIYLATPPEFDFEQCLAYLTRSADECLHQVEGQAVFKALPVEGGRPTLCKLTEDAGRLQLSFLNGQPDKLAQEAAMDYVRQWFDLQTDLSVFYRIAAQDKVLGLLTQTYYGLRLIGIPDLFEALCWAIIGQQINVAFAYIVKRRFVEAFGERLDVGGVSYWLFPRPEQVARLQAGDLRALQFSTRKAEYIIGLAQLLAQGELSQDKLQQLHDFEQMQAALVQLRGIGRWTANYVLMRCFRHPRAFPIDDVGLHNAVRLAYQLQDKPAIEEIQTLFEPWAGWEAYATFYLWRALI